LSMGVQTFNPAHRKMIGRTGDANAVYTAIDLMKQRNFTNLSVDLIYAIPNQTLAEWEKDLRTAAELGVQHISAYSLTVEEGAALAGTSVEEAESDISFEMWERAEQVLGEYGLQRYEISNYAKPGFECQHNANIWAGQPYLGLGPSAVSFDGEQRWEQPANLQDWLNGVEPEYDVIDAESRAREIFIMGLRTTKGWNREEFLNRTSFDFVPWLESIVHLESHGFFKTTPISNIQQGISNFQVQAEHSKFKIHTSKLQSFALTSEGLAFWNTIGEELI